MVKNMPVMQETGSVPGSERCPGEGNWYPLQYSCLENSMDRGVHEVAELDTTEMTDLADHAFMVKSSMTY